LKTGSDLAHIFCAKDAATPIKAYSPEIIVHPIFELMSSLSESDDKDVLISEIVASVGEWLPRIHSLVIGPGLGRDRLMLESVSLIILAAREQKIPLIIDGDALFLVSQRPDLIRGYSNAILTPNGGEFIRLWKAEMGSQVIPRAGAYSSFHQSSPGFYLSGTCEAEEFGASAAAHLATRY
jgi:ATP-dependent NAD(P)H-hydrate dehydratase